MSIINELHKLRAENKRLRKLSAENARLRKALADREASDEPTRGQYHKGELDAFPCGSQCYGHHHHEDTVAAEIAADEQRVAEEYAEMYGDDAPPALRATFGETVPAFRESPLGPGIGPKPYVTLRNPEDYVDAEDDGATEAFMARGRAVAPRRPHYGI